MTRIVAYDWLAAETEAWPLSSPSAFRRRTTHLGQVNTGCLDDSTLVLANDLEAWIRPRSAGRTLEMLKHIRNNAWFPDGRLSISITEHTIRLAQRYLTSMGGRLGLRVDDEIGMAERAGRWRWLSYVLPEDLLVATLAAAEGGTPSGETVGLLTPHLRQILREREVAETHLHLGAAVPFSWLWTSFMSTLADDPPSLRDLERSGVPSAFTNAGEWLGHFFAAAIARLLLAEFLRRQSAEPAVCVDFETFVNGRGAGSGIEQIARWLTWPDGAEAGSQALTRALAVLGAGEAPRLQELLPLYRRLIGHRSRRFNPSDLAFKRRDPLLGDAFDAGEREALPETSLSARAIGYLLSDGRRDPLFELIFWQYQRMRCLTFRHLVEEPGTGGLDWFSLHYYRIPPFRKGLDGAIYHAALESESVDCRMASLEVRMAPPSNAQEVIREVRRFATQARDFQAKRNPDQVPDFRGPEIGLVLHFIKEWFASGGKRLHADPQNCPPFFCRFGSWYYPRLQQAMAIEAALERAPEILLILRGLDMANNELAIPSWVSLPLFERIRKASVRASERLRWKRPLWEVEPLRMTAHLGEDFVRLAQGLRHIHEPIEFGLLCVGSRIGHAVALGVDPATWASACVSVPQTIEERLEDLLWELDRYGHADLPAEIGRLEFVRHEATRLAERVYGKRADLYDLLEARRRLHSPACLEQFEYPFVRKPRMKGKDRAHKLLWRYLTDPGVFGRGQEKVEVIADEGEIRFLRSAQQWLRRLLGRLEITVESNPSSNLLIGDFVALEEHPAFRLHPLASGRSADEGPVMLSVNVDDPVTFASNLANEYAHIYFALTRRKVASEEALEWLNRVREHGWRSRFTLPASRSVANLEELCSTLRVKG